MSVLAALNDALSELALKPEDGAAVALAKTYAEQIDDATKPDLTRLGPALLSCLESLGMTPKARAALAGKGATTSADSPLDELRARRAARQNGA